MPKKTSYMVTFGAKITEAAKDLPPIALPSVVGSAVGFSSVLFLILARFNAMVAFGGLIVGTFMLLPVTKYFTAYEVTIAQHIKQLVSDIIAWKDYTAGGETESDRDDAVLERMPSRYRQCSMANLKREFVRIARQRKARSGDVDSEKQRPVRPSKAFACYRKYAEANNTSVLVLLQAREAYQAAIVTLIAGGAVIITDVSSATFGYRTILGFFIPGEIAWLVSASIVIVCVIAPILMVLGIDGLARADAANTTDDDIATINSQNREIYGEDDFEFDDFEDGDFDFGEFDL